jgi:SAM-dependent methyltransferase
MEVELRALIQRDARLESVPLEQMRGQSIRAVASNLLERLGFQSAGAAKDRESEPFSVWLREREAALAAAFASGEPALVGKELGKTVDELDVRAAAVAPVDERECRARLRDRLGKFFFQSAFLRRAMDKPFGYPGDFQMMDQIYRNEPSGEGIARIIDGFALARPTAQANRNRVPYIADILRRACPPGTNVRVVSIGCGPAWEARVLAASEPELAARIHLTLVDQEPRALAACKAAFAGIAGSFASVRFIEAPIEELATRGSDAQRAITGSDVVYSAGLFDYFNDHNFVVYLQAMYDALRPGGRLMVGNVSPGNPDKRLLEYVTEWILYYRSEPELEVLSRRITPEPAWSAIEVEPLGINYFLVAERPA